MDFEKPPIPARQRLVEVTLDEASISRRDSDAAHDREVAIYDLIEENHFGLDGRDDGPYKLMLAIVEDRLAFHISVAEGDATMTHLLSLSPLKRIIKDYFTVCESYYQAIRTAPPSRIQAIDMGRRALHDEGSRTLTERLRGKIIVDHDTARRLFTLICALVRKA